MKRHAMRHLHLILTLALLLPGLSWAAGFDCGKAAAPIEQAICADPELSLADFILNERHQHLLAQCGARPAAQREWLAERRAAFRPGDEGLAELRSSYRQRNVALLAELDACSLRRKPAPLKVETVSRPGSELRLPWVVASSPEIARRINDVVFQRMLDMPAPALLREAREARPVQIDGEPVRGLASGEFRLLRNDGRLLALELSGEGCGAYCSGFTEQYLFDARNGRQVENAALFTEEGLMTLTRYYRGRVLAEARARIAHARRERTEEDEVDHYRGCLRDWAGEFHGLPVPWLTSSGAWQLQNGTCSFHARMGWDQLDGITVPLPPALLAAHLSPYGKSLLLGQGDVRDPAPPPPRCAALAEPAAPAVSAFRSASYGGDHSLAVLADGRLVAWGANSDGQLGNGQWINGYRPWAPEQIGQGFTAVAAGAHWSAAIDEAGTLWTWGSNYAGALGNGGQQGQTRPGAIAKDIVAVRAEGQSGLALHRDGRLIAWGGRTAGRDSHSNSIYVTTPWQLAEGVAQVEWGPRGEIQVLGRDGVLRTWAGFNGSGSPHPEDRPRTLGGGFTRLAGHRLQAAFKADGSLWAWAGSLAAMVDTQGDRDRPPQPVGNGFEQVVSAPDDQVATLKADGSLWLTHTRGRVTQLEPVGCGFRRIALVGASWRRDPLLRVQVVALRGDGSLQVWPMQDGGKGTAKTAPWALGRGWQQIEMLDGHWGNHGPTVLVVDADGKLWQQRRLEENAQRSAETWLERVELPKP